MEGSSTGRATAFGMDITCAAPVAFLSGANAAATGRAISLSIHPGELARTVWPQNAKLICDEKLPSGDINFRIETNAREDYLLWGPEYGSHLLSADASSLRCFPEGQPDGAWQRLLIAQALPFGALLHGLEVFHASAVGLEGTAIAFLGASGSGKTSIALEFCQRGACFIADDVLALEHNEGELLAHPGSPVAGVNNASTSPDGREHPEGLPTIAALERESIVGVSGASGSLPLSSLFFLDRRRDGPQAPQFTAVNDALSLLTSTFNFVLATPARLKGLLNVCAIASRLRVERIRIGPGTDLSTLADAVERRLGLT
jgi:hypothetical protein